MHTLRKRLHTDTPVTVQGPGRDDEPLEVSEAQLCLGARQLRSKFRSEQEKNYRHLLTDKSEIHFLVASAVDPRFRKLRFVSEEQRKEVYRFVIKLAGEMSGTEDAGIDEAQMGTQQKRQKRHLGMQSFLDDMEEVVHGPTVSTRLTPKQHEKMPVGSEVFLWMEQDEISSAQDPLQWYKQEGAKWPRISLLARKYLAKPASNAAVERLFSLARHLLNYSRISMDSDMCETHVITQKNLPQLGSWKPSRE